MPLRKMAKVEWVSAIVLELVQPALHRRKHAKAYFAPGKP
jgi:hypothetical protein